MAQRRLRALACTGRGGRLSEVAAATANYHGAVPDYFETESGFQRYEITVGLPQNPLGMIDYSK